MTQEFFEWLNQCPVQWFLLTSDDEQKIYQFIIEDIELIED